MCHQRLSAGEAPACVQACPNEAIAITLVDRTVASDAAGLDSNQRLAAGAPLSSITKPTTKYISSRSDQVAAAMPQDAGVDEVAESHWPLAIMLVATQVSVGMIIAERCLSLAWVVSGIPTSETITRWTALVALLIGAAGLNIAPLHLGQPLRAWRVFLGLRTSWLSREAVVLGKYMGALAAAVGLLWMPVFADWVPESIAAWIPDWAGKAALGLSIPLGVLGLYSSAMIYIATKRELWRSSRTLVRFFGSALVVGMAMVASIVAVAGSGQSAAVIGLFAALITSAKLAWEFRTHLGPSVANSSVDLDRRSHRLVSNHLSTWAKVRIASASVGALTLLLAASIAPAAPMLSGVISLLAASLILGGELAERLLYFSSVVYERMPGTL
jgi:DMSO reductase anchor subunit